jgi:hypothetical protein
MGILILRTAKSSRGGGTGGASSCLEATLGGDLLGNRAENLALRLRFAASARLLCANRNELPHFGVTFSSVNHVRATTGITKAHGYPDRRVGVEYFATQIADEDDLLGHFIPI